MYSRDFGEGIRSEGNLQEYIRSSLQPTEPQPPKESIASIPENTAESAAAFCNKHGGEGSIGGIKRILHNIQTDDLILIGLGILLLMDSDTDNDTLIILILLLLFF